MSFKAVDVHFGRAGVAEALENFLEEGARAEFLPGGGSSVRFMDREVALEALARVRAGASSADRDEAARCRKNAEKLEEALAKAPATEVEAAAARAAKAALTAQRLQTAAKTAAGWKKAAAAHREAAKAEEALARVSENPDEHVSRAARFDAAATAASRRARSLS